MLKLVLVTLTSFCLAKSESQNSGIDQFARHQNPSGSGGFQIAQPAFEPARPLNPSYEPARPLNPQYEPARPINSQYEPARPINPSYQPARPLNPSFQPGTGTNPAHQPARRPAGHLGFQSARPSGISVEHLQNGDIVASLTNPHLPAARSDYYFMSRNNHGHGQPIFALPLPQLFYPQHL